MRTDLQPTAHDRGLHVGFERIRRIRSQVI